MFKILRWYLRAWL